MEKKNYNDLSEVQKKLYKSICGFDYIENSIKGRFTTIYPSRDFHREVSPWLFEFEFHKETGYLFCALHHRMTNSRPFAWDYIGNELDWDERKIIFPLFLM